MPKSRKTLRVKIPPYAPSLTWREDVLTATRAARRERAVKYARSDRLALDVRVYLSGKTLARKDVDNLLKDVMDALQGQTGGRGKKIMTPKNPIIRNDRQVWRVYVEKLERPFKLDESAGGWLTISKL